MKASSVEAHSIMDTVISPRSRLLTGTILLLISSWIAYRAAAYLLLALPGEAMSFALIGTNTEGKTSTPIGKGLADLIWFELSWESAVSKAHQPAVLPLLAIISLGLLIFDTFRRGRGGRWLIACWVFLGMSFLVPCVIFLSDHVSKDPLSRAVHDLVTQSSLRVRFYWLILPAILCSLAKLIMPNEYTMKTDLEMFQHHRVVLSSYQASLCYGALFVSTAMSLIVAGSLILGLEFDIIDNTWLWYIREGYVDMGFGPGAPIYVGIENKDGLVPHVYWRPAFVPFVVAMSYIAYSICVVSRRQGALWQSALWLDIAWLTFGFGFVLPSIFLGLPSWTATQFSSSVFVWNTMAIWLGIPAVTLAIVHKYLLGSINATAETENPEPQLATVL
jgi:hypothetical protein